MPPPAPVVTGISPNEATPGTKITIRGENFGLVASDLLGINILGKYDFEAPLNTITTFWYVLMSPKMCFLEEWLDLILIY